VPSVSKAQQRFMGLVHAYKKGEVPASKVSKAVKDAAKSMKKKSTKKFASTKHDDLPNKVRSENMNEDGHTDVASAERKLKLIMKDAMDTLNALRGLSNEDSLPSWWTDKITLAKDYVGKSRDYIMNPAESVKESVINEKIEPKVKSQINVLDKRLRDLKLADARLEQATWEAIGAYAKIYSMVENGKYFEIAGFKQIPGSLELLNKRFSQKFSKSLDSIIKSTRDSVKRLKLKESVNEESKTIKSIQNLADKNKYGTVSGTRMNGKTAREIIAIYNHPKMKSFRGKMDKLKSHELMDLTIRLPKMLGIKVESVNEKVIKVSKKDDIPGNPMKMKGEEKIKKLTYSGSVGMDKPGSYEIKGNKLNVNNIRPRDKGFFVRHFTMGTGFRKANLYYDGVHWQGGKKF